MSKVEKGTHCTIILNKLELNVIIDALDIFYSHCSSDTCSDTESKFLYNFIKQLRED